MNSYQEDWNVLDSVPVFCSEFEAYGVWAFHFLSLWMPFYSQSCALA